jgi:hypothetical protein
MPHLNKQRNTNRLRKNYVSSALARLYSLRVKLAQRRVYILTFALASIIASLFTCPIPIEQHSFLSAQYSRFLNDYSCDLFTFSNASKQSVRKGGELVGKTN